MNIDSVYCPWEKIESHRGRALLRNSLRQKCYSEKNFFNCALYSSLREVKHSVLHVWSHVFKRKDHEVNYSWKT